MKISGYSYSTQYWAVVAVCAFLISGCGSGNGGSSHALPVTPSPASTPAALSPAGGTVAVGNGAGGWTCTMTATEISGGVFNGQASCGTGAGPVGSGPCMFTVMANGSANGSASGIANASANGTANGSANGTANGTLNGTISGWCLPALSTSLQAIVFNSTQAPSVTVTVNTSGNATVVFPAANGSANGSANGTVNGALNGNAKVTFSAVSNNPGIATVISDSACAASFIISAAASGSATMTITDNFGDTITIPITVQ